MFPLRLGGQCLSPRNLCFYSCIYSSAHLYSAVMVITLNEGRFVVSTIFREIFGGKMCSVVLEAFLKMYVNFLKILKKTLREKKNV